MRQHVYADWPAIGRSTIIASKGYAIMHRSEFLGSNRVPEGKEGLMWGSKSVSVVLMTYREKASIRSVIDEFFATGVVDEVVVVDNNAETGTFEQVSATRARLVSEPRQGYGYASRRGMEEATGDLVVLAEPDGTFAVADILKLLAYSDQFDAVFGSRTHPQLIWADANMKWHLRAGNVAVAKGLRLLYRSAALTDVGCTYRLFTRDAVNRLLPELRVGGSQLGPELMAKTVLAGMRHIEVPVNYLPRVGQSSVTGDLRKAVLLGFQMIGLLIWMRVVAAARRGKTRVVRSPSEPPELPDLNATRFVVDLRAQAPSEVAESATEEWQR